MKKLVLFTFLICVPFIGFSQTETNQQSNDWEIDVTPYIWLTGNIGDIEASLNSGNDMIGAALSDAWDPLATTGLLSVEASKGKWTIMANAFYANIDKEGVLTSSFNDISLGKTVNVEVCQTLVELGGAYRFAQIDSFTLKVLFGGRYYGFNTNLSGTESNELYDEKNDFIDPYVGLALSNYWNKFGIMGSIDVGGFGIGSDISSKLNLMAGYQAVEFLEVKLGYQAYMPVYTSDEIDYSISSKGFLFGLDFSF